MFFLTAETPKYELDNHILRTYFKANTIGQKPFEVES